MYYFINRYFQHLVCFYPQMERSETVCCYCGVSYLIFHEFHQLHTQLAQLKGELQDLREAAQREKAQREALELDLSGTLNPKATAEYSECLESFRRFLVSGSNSVNLAKNLTLLSHIMPVCS
uniref:Uncharacterized protein n=1 Tax=Amphilophus citrinellus TaxID=61819 RepID=A0A3Q0S714_AMPCI